MRPHHSPDASTFPGFKLMCFVYITSIVMFTFNASSLKSDLNVLKQFLCDWVFLHFAEFEQAGKKSSGSSNEVDMF